MDARLGTRPTTALTAAALALLLALLAVLASPAAAQASTGAEPDTSAEEGTVVIEQVDPLAAGLAIVALLVALGLVFLLARRLFRSS